MKRTLACRTIQRDTAARFALCTMDPMSLFWLDLHVLVVVVVVVPPRNITRRVAALPFPPSSSMEVVLCEVPRHIG